MVWIAGQTLSSNSSFSFTSIPQTFTHLQLRFIGQVYVASGTGAAGLYIGANSDSNMKGAHYLYGNGSSAISTYDSISSIAVSNYGFANTPSIAIIDILDYTNTNKNKTLKSLYGYDANGSGWVGLNSTLYLSTNAITSLSFTGGGANILSGARCDLYGITSSQETGA
jgi:hypothetical protein